MDFIVPQWQSGAEVGALSTLRSGGVSQAPYDDGAGGGGLNLALHVKDDERAVLQNRALLRRHVPAEPAWLAQVHGTRVVDAAQVRGVPEADASFTTEPRVACAIMTADCLAVLLRDVRGGVVGAAHAGWRGLAGGVLENTVRAMRAAGADEIEAWLGPAIGPRHFEVGDDVRAAFCRLGASAASAFTPVAGKAGKHLADLPQLARLALAQEGVRHVGGGADCTYGDARRFYSFRRSPVTGRMASLIWLR